MTISKKHLLVAAIATVLGGTDAFAMMPPRSAEEIFDMPVIENYQETAPLGISVFKHKGDKATISLLEDKIEGVDVRKGVRNIEKLLKKYEKVKYITLSALLTSAEVEVLVDIANRLKLRVLDLRDDDIDDKSAEALSKLPYGVNLILSHNHIGDKGGRALAKYAERINSSVNEEDVVYVLLDHNEITPECVKELRDKKIPGLIIGQQ